MAVERCDSDLPQTEIPIFRNGTMTTFAILSIASGLEYRLQHRVSIECGFVWACAKVLDSGLATCGRLADLTADDAETEYKRVFRRNDPPRSRWESERLQVYNVGFLRGGGRRAPVVLDFNEPITPNLLLAAIIAAFNFNHAANVPFRRSGVNLQTLVNDLSGKDSFLSTAKLDAMGEVPPDRSTILTLAAEKAAYIGSWLITKPCVQSAARELGVSITSAADAEEDLRHWENEVTSVRASLAAGLGTNLLAFPGRRPWSYEASRILFPDSAQEI